MVTIKQTAHVPRPSILKHLLKQKYVAGVIGYHLSKIFFGALMGILVIIAFLICEYL